MHNFYRAFYCSQDIRKFKVCLYKYAHPSFWYTSNQADNVKFMTAFNTISQHVCLLVGIPWQCGSFLFYWFARIPLSHLLCKSLFSTLLLSPLAFLLPRTPSWDPAAQSSSCPWGLRDLSFFTSEDFNESDSFASEQLECLWTFCAIKSATPFGIKCFIATSNVQYKLLQYRASGKLI